MRFIVKLSSESFIKSRSVRSWHITRLQNNISKVLRLVDSKARVIERWDRLEIDCTEDKVNICRQRLGDIPGISQILAVDKYILPAENPLDGLAEQAVSYFADSLRGKSFVVRCRRAGQHDFRSIDAERHVGAVLLQNSEDSRVNLKYPDITVSIEIQRERAYFVREKLPGLGGYPLGTQGTVLSLISGGYDSSVASYQMMRRGCRVHFLFFNLGGPAHSLGAQQAALYLWQKFGCSYPARFISVPLDHFVTELMQLPQTTFNGVLLKRAMLRVADAISQKANAEALVTGESLAQVASQTLANLAVIDQATNCLVVRPLITMDKADIIGVAEQIGSAIFARNMVEYCGVISNKPTISASLDTLLELEQQIGDDWYQSALDKAEIVNVADIINHVNNQPKVELVREPSDQVVIDIRATDKPLELADLHIPFYEVNHRFAALEQDKDYLLYCEKGVMSQLHAAYLHEQGFQNVKVYRPVT